MVTITLAHGWLANYLKEVKEFMNKKQVQQVMSLARPAIIALYGRQPLTLTKYEKGLVYANTVERLYLQVKGKEDVYKVEIQDNEVIKLGVLTEWGKGDFA